ncbi:hypothetical protein DLM76_11755 [Leptospira yasudae]|nr:hypothetical protein DLM76_11755 [Leptospira yasudae]
MIFLIEKTLPIFSHEPATSTLTRVGAILYYGKIVGTPKNKKSPRKIPGFFVSAFETGASVKVGALFSISRNTS